MIALITDAIIQFLVAQKSYQN